MAAMAAMAAWRRAPQVGVRAKQTAAAAATPAAGAAAAAAKGSAKGAAVPASAAPAAKAAAGGEGKKEAADGRKKSIRPSARFFRELDDDSDYVTDPDQVRPAPFF
jgi:hypothetical protein